MARSTASARSTSGIAEDHAAGRQRQAGQPQRLAASRRYSQRARALPDAVRFPEARAAVDGRKQRTDDADAAAGGQIDLDAGFVQGAQHPGVIGAARPRAGQDERGPQPGGIRAVRRVVGAHTAGC